MKLSLRFNPLAIKPSVFFLLGFWKFEAELGDEAIGGEEQYEKWYNGLKSECIMGLICFMLVRPIKSFSKWPVQLGLWI